MHAAATAVAPPSPFQPGMVVGGRYRLKAPIGKGAMGEVWRAEHATLGTTLAVKLVETSRHPDPAALLARFHREARSAAALRSPHIVRIHDHGVDGGVAFMTMDMLEGEGLERRLAARGRLSPSEAAAVVVGMAHAVDCAHAAGIVHRDLKPSNVFLAWEGAPGAIGRETVKVLDFGIAKSFAPGPDVQLETHAGVVMGTPAYMSPEQVLGEGVGPASDLWQIGVVAFECLVGERPFQGLALGQLFQRICAGNPPVPSSIAPVPRGFDGWFARAVALSPSERFTSGVELADAFCVAVGEPAPSFALAELSTATGSRAWAAAQREVLRPARRRRALLFAGGMLLPAAIGAAVWAIARGGEVAPVADAAAATSSAQPIVAAAPVPASSSAPAPPTVTASASAAPSTSARAHAPARERKPPHGAGQRVRSAAPPSDPIGL
jgi:serine/threonine-protein kinase